MALLVTNILFLIRGDEPNVQAAAVRIAYWQLDEVSGPPYANSDGGSHEGTCTVCPTAVPGQINGAQLFNGSNTTIDVPPAAAFDWSGSDSFSIELWMKAIPGQTCASADETMVGRADSGNSLYWSLGCTAVTGTAHFTLHDTNGISLTLHSTKTITTGVWHHVVGIHDGTSNTNYLYVDGFVVSGSQTYSGSFASPVAALNLGHVDGSAHFEGSLDEVAVYNEALTADEIRSHYYLSRAYDEMCDTAVHIMPLGDSITKGYASGEDDPTRQIAYRHALWHSLINNGYNVNFVGSLQNGQYYTPLDGFDPDHQGTEGWTTADVNTNINLILAAHPPDVILLHIGTNGVTNPSNVTNVEQTLDKIKLFDDTITVVLARIINRSPNGTHSPTITYNNSLETMALERIADGDKIIIIDMENDAGINYAAQPTGDMYDTLHPYGSGYTKMANLWFNTLDSFLPGDCEAAAAIVSTPITTTIINQPYSYDVNAAGNPAPTYSLIVTPTGMTINAITGLVAWTPTMTGTFDVTVEAANPLGSDTQSFTITVTDGSVAPTFTSIPLTTATLNQPYSYDVEAIGVPTPTYSLVVTPTGMTINAATGLITWLPGSTGVFTVSVQASNSAGSAVQSFNVSVTNSLICVADRLAYWKLDDAVSSTTFADAEGSHPGSCTNCPTAAMGQVGGAFSFDGSNDYIQVPNHADFAWGSSDSFSIELWVNTTQNCTGDKAFISKFFNSSSAFWGVGCGAENTVRFHIRDSDSDMHLLTGETQINDGAWHHIAAIREGDSVNQTRLYVDGVLDGSLNHIYTGNFTNTAFIGIGRFSTLNNFHFNGRLDEIAIYSRALSPAEIEQHYQEGLAGQPYTTLNASWSGPTSGDWHTSANWSTNQVPDQYTNVTVTAGSEAQLSANGAAACLSVEDDAAVDLNTFSLTVEDSLVNEGTLRQTQTVNNSAADFLHILNIAGNDTKYRGVVITTTNNLGDVAVAVRATDPDADEYCTTTGDGSPDYANRCYTITPQTDGAATVRLWALDSERHGISIGDLAPYRYVAGVGWTQLAPFVNGTADGGNYVYAEGDTPGFSSFLLGDNTTTGPTAVNLVNIQAELGLGVPLLSLTMLLVFATLVIAYRRSSVQSKHTLLVTRK